MQVHPCLLHHIGYPAKQTGKEHTWSRLKEQCYRSLFLQLQESEYISTKCGSNEYGIQQI